MSSDEGPAEDQFELYDLRVEVVAGDRPMVCGHEVGQWFEVRGEDLYFPNEQRFSMYALAAILPILPAKQRKTDANDWMTTDPDIACPDPNCGGRFRIRRVGTRTFRHSEVTVTTLQGTGTADKNPAGADPAGADPADTNADV